MSWRGGSSVGQSRCCCCCRCRRGSGRVGGGWRRRGGFYGKVDAEELVGELRRNPQVAIWPGDYANWPLHWCGQRCERKLLEYRGGKRSHPSETIGALQGEPKVSIWAGDDVHRAAVRGDRELCDVRRVGGVDSCYPSGDPRFERPHEAVGASGNATRITERARKRELFDFERRRIDAANSAVPVLSEPNLVIWPQSNRVRPRIAKRGVNWYWNFDNGVRALTGIDVTNFVFGKFGEPNSAVVVAGDVQ